MMKKRMQAAAAAAMALAMLGGALPVVPGGAELLKAPLTAHAAGSVTLDRETGTLYLDGAVTKEQIWAYRENNAVESIVAAEGCVLPEDCCGLFKRQFVRTIEDDDDNPIDIWSWDGVERIDLTEASTSAVKNMGYMFSGYQGESLDLSSFDTSNVTYMSPMFYECKNLTSLDLSGFDTSNVTHMQE